LGFLLSERFRVFGLFGILGSGLTNVEAESTTRGEADEHTPTRLCRYAFGTQLEAIFAEKYEIKTPICLCVLLGSIIQLSEVGDPSI